MFLKKIVLLSILMLVTACNVGNTKPDTEVVTEPDTELQELVSLRQQADSYYKNSDWNKAIEYYGQLIQQVPKDGDIWFRMGNAYARLNKPGTAIQAYQTALKLNPNNSKAWHNMGIIQLQSATLTFENMKNYTNPEDALYERARQVVDAISELLQQEFGIDSDN